MSDTIDTNREPQRPVPRVNGAKREPAPAPTPKKEKSGTRKDETSKRKDDEAVGITRTSLGDRMSRNTGLW